VKKEDDFYLGGRLDWYIGRWPHGSYQGGKAVESAVNVHRLTDICFGFLLLWYKYTEYTA
jgi:hypothetical protein